MATEAKRLAPFFMPSLGPAPRWCAFLENLTEEMQEAGQVRSAARAQPVRQLTAALRLVHTSRLCTTTIAS